MSSVSSFQPTGFSLEIFTSRYALTPDETWQGACRRVAHQMVLSEVPEKMQVYEDKFYDVLSQNLFVPGGRIWRNSGRANPQLLNCFVLTDQLDSKEGWGRISYEMIVTSMTGGGCGIDFSDVRPDGADIKGNGGTCPGPVELMELINGNAKPVVSGGGRRVALMFSLDLDHPDVDKFLDYKLTQGKLAYANVSVRSKRTRDFIKAVKNDGDWELSWKGKYKKTVKAKALWDKIVYNAWNSAEPGFLNWEYVLDESNIWYIEELTTTNPCGEIAMSPYDCCCLGHIVLPRFVKDGKIDWHALGNTIRLGVRFLDNVLDVNHFPLPEMQKKSQEIRRIGLGTTGLGDLLAIMGFRYGSKEAVEFCQKLYRFISKAAYDSSILLAVEKGAFPLCNPKKHIESGFMKRMTPKIKALVLEHGIRNCAILTQAPTGTTSILSGNLSAALEPIYSPAYWRRYWEGKVRKQELVFHPLFLEYMDQGKDVSGFISSMDLTIRDHMEIQKVVQDNVDNAVSKTINMPKDYPVEEMSKVWLEYLPYLKGTTFYREGSRHFVRDDGTLEEPPLVAISLEDAIKLYHTEKEKTADAAFVSDCPSGVCQI